MLVAGVSFSGEGRSVGDEVRVRTGFLRVVRIFLTTAKKLV